MVRQEPCVWMKTSTSSFSIKKRRRRHEKYNTMRSVTASRAKLRQVEEASMVLRAITASVSRLVTVPSATNTPQPQRPSSSDAVYAGYSLRISVKDGLGLVGGAGDVRFVCEAILLLSIESCQFHCADIMLLSCTVKWM